jgi:hypothetical protein
MSFKTHPVYHTLITVIMSYGSYGMTLLKQYFIWYDGNVSNIHVGNALMLHIILKLIKWGSFLFDWTLHGPKLK